MGEKTRVKERVTLREKTTVEERAETAEKTTIKERAMERQAPIIHKRPFTPRNTPMITTKHCRKHQYLTYEHAKRALRDILYADASTHRLLHVYHCPWCSYWHVGHAQRTGSRRRAR
jgi:hypothetical protein